MLIVFSEGGVQFIFTHMLGEIIPCRNLIHHSLMLYRFILENEVFHRWHSRELWFKPRQMQQESDLLRILTSLCSNFY